jgi:hypothetical protein
MKSANQNHHEVFTKIYHNNYWGGEGIPKSGSGSLPKAAAPYVNLVSEFINQKQISSVLDIGHGDWAMWQEYKFEGVSYTGIDVFEEASTLLNFKHKNEARIFLTRNAVTEELPRMQMCITKDVLQHLPNSDIIAILKKLNRFDYLIICNDYYKFSWRDLVPAVRRFVSAGERVRKLALGKIDIRMKLNKSNSNSIVGGHRPLNLEKKPFAENLKQFELISKVDFSGSIKKRANLVKRIYVYRNLQTSHFKIENL